MSRTVTGARGGVDGPAWNDQYGGERPHSPEPVDAYFGFMGGGPLEWISKWYYDTGTALGFEWTPAMHIFDFAGSLENFSITTFGNNSESATAYVVRKSATAVSEVEGAPVVAWSYPQLEGFEEATQFVVMPASWDGRMVCLNEAAEFVLDDAVLCYVASDNPGENSPSLPGSGQYKKPGLSDVQVDIVTADVPRTVYNTTAGWDQMEREGSPYTSAPVAIGGGGPIWSWYTQKYLSGPQGGESTDDDWPARATFLLMRSRGYFSYLQASGWGYNLDGGSGSAFFRLGIMDPLEPNVPSEEDAGSYVYAGAGYDADIHAYAVNHANTMEALTGNLVGLWCVLNANGYGTGVHKISMNWRGPTSRSNTDWVLREEVHDSRQRPEQALTDPYGDYATYGNYWDYVFLDGSTRYRRWYIHPMGPIHPHLDMRGPEDEDNPLRRAQFEVVFNEARTISRLRAFVQDNADGRHVTLGVMVDGVDSGVTVDIHDEGWVENEVDFVDVPAGGRVTLFAEAAGVTSDRGDVEYFDHARVHIATIMFSYGDGIEGRPCLTRVLPDAVPVEALPCGTHLARCVKITRGDGEVFAYTEHDRALTYDGTTFQSCAGFQGSASELGSVVGEVGNMEIEGFARALNITQADVFGGKFDGATVEVWLLPWGESYDTQPARQVSGGTIGKITQEGVKFVMEQLSLSAYMKQRALLEVVTPTCRFELGSSRCGVALESMRVSGMVTLASANEDVGDLSGRRRFTDASRTEDDGFFDEGSVTFTSGANTGQTAKVKSFEAGEFVLWEPLIYDVAAYDEYTAVPGCDKLAATCKVKFDNYPNFGGFEHTPGLDAVSQSPSGRMGE